MRKVEYYFAFVLIVLLGASLGVAAPAASIASNLGASAVSSAVSGSITGDSADLASGSDLLYLKIGKNISNTTEENISTQLAELLERITLLEGKVASLESMISKDRDEYNRTSMLFEDRIIQVEDKLNRSRIPRFFRNLLGYTV